MGQSREVTQRNVDRLYEQLHDVLVFLSGQALDSQREAIRARLENLLRIVDHDVGYKEGISRLDDEGYNEYEKILTELYYKMTAGSRADLYFVPGPGGAGYQMLNVDDSNGSADEEAGRENEIKTDVLYTILDNLISSIKNGRRQVVSLFSGNNTDAQFRMVEEYVNHYVGFRRSYFEMTGDRSNVENCPDYRMIYTMVSKAFFNFARTYIAFGAMGELMAMNELQEHILRFLNPEAMIMYNISYENINRISRAINDKHFLVRN